MAIEYNSDTLKLLHSLSIINDSILVTEDEDGNLKVANSNVEKTAAYVLKAPKKHLDFTGDTVGFLSFRGFYKMLTAMAGGDIERDVNDPRFVIIRKNRAEIKYRLADADVIKRQFNGVNMGEPAFTLAMPSVLIKKLGAFASQQMLKTNRMKLEVEEGGTDLTLTLKASKDHTNMYKEVIALEEPAKQAVSFATSTDIFNKIPTEYDYEMSVLPQGLIEFSMDGDDDCEVELKLYTAKMEDQK